MASNVEKTYQERILSVLIYIQNHLDDSLSLEKLAEIAHFSPYHFHRIFTACAGESVKSYLRRLRLERATRDLIFTELSLTLISERAGYDTQQSFHRAFKEMYNTTPTEFRVSKQAAFLSGIKNKEIQKSQPTVAIKKVEPMQVAFVRHIGEYSTILQSWFTLANAVGIAHISSDQTKKISIPYDHHDLTPLDKLRYDACVSIDALKNFKPSGQVGVQEIHGGKYAVIMHYGPLEKIESTYEVLFGLWLPTSGYEPDDFPNFILHHTIPLSIEQDKVISEIYLPIKKV